MHYGTLNEYRFADQGNDIRGTLLYGEDNEKLGTIHDVIFDHESGAIKYAVIDTGGWLRHKYFLVPANRIMPYERHQDHFYAKLRKEQIESLPPYDPKVVENHERWSEYEGKYNKAWEDDGIFHLAGTDRIITPDPSEVPPDPSGRPLTASDMQGRDIWPKRRVSPTEPPHGPTAQMHPDEQTPTSAAVEPTSTGGSMRKMDERLGTFGDNKRLGSFENEVKRNLGDIQKCCPACGSGGMKRTA